MAAQSITKNIKARVKYEMEIRSIKPLEMAAALGMAQRTFYERLSKPETITLGEIEKIAKKLNKKPEELFFSQV